MTGWNTFFEEMKKEKEEEREKKYRQPQFRGRGKNLKKNVNYLGGKNMKY